MNEDGSNGCVRRSAGVTDSRWTARDDAPAARAAAASSSSHPIWLDELTCTGDEREVGECQRAGWGVHDCGHKEDAGCICTPRPTLSPVRGRLNDDHADDDDERKEEYLYSAFSHQGTYKALRHRSHSFTCKQHHACQMGGFVERVLFHDLLLRSYLYRCVWSVITAHNLTPEKRDNNYSPHPVSLSRS